MLGVRSHDAGQHGPAAQSNQPAVTLPMFITDALSFEASSHFDPFIALVALMRGKPHVRMTSCGGATCSRAALKPMQEHYSRTDMQRDSILGQKQPTTTCACAVADGFSVGSHGQRQYPALQHAQD